MYFITLTLPFHPASVYPRETVVKIRFPGLVYDRTNRENSPRNATDSTIALFIARDPCERAKYK